MAGSVWYVCDSVITMPLTLTVKVFSQDCSRLHSGKGASTAESPLQAVVIKVAALSNFDIGVTSEPVLSQNDHNIISETFSW
jgi:hypothetical protein